MKTEVYEKLPVHFNMVGQVVSRPLRITNECITKGLAQRLYKYALDELVSHGFDGITKGASVTVYTIDAEDSPSDRSYCVRWHSPKGGYIELVGVLTQHGWPSLNHGFDIGYENF